MKKAISGLGVLYPKMIHLTCISHGLHRLAEHVRTNFENVNRLISETKMVFLKSPARCQTFVEKAIDIPLPPKPIITRWCTWLNAAFYYCEHFETVSNIVDSFDSRDAECIVRAKQAFSSRNIRENLIFIKSNFELVVEAVTYFENTQLNSSQAFEKITLVQNSLFLLADSRFSAKFNDILSRNPGFDIIKRLSDVINGISQLDDELKDRFTIEEITKFKYMPFSSTEVERVFSVYKSMLRDNRRSIIFENLAKLVVLKCNQNLTNIPIE